MCRNALLLFAAFLLAVAAHVASAGTTAPARRGGASRNATSTSPLPTLHNMPARIARRKAAEAKKRATLPVALRNKSAAAAAGAWPPTRQTLVKPRVLPQPPRVEPRPQHAAPTAATADAQPSKAARPTQAKLSAAAVKASKPKAATAVPAFADLYVKAKAKTVGPLLQQLAKDPGAMRLLFNDWKRRFKKAYRSSAADKAAFSKFTANLKAIAAENVKGKMFLGLNQFSDMTSAEFRSKILTLKKPKTPIKKAGGVFGSLPTAVFSAAAPAKAVDWRTSGKVTPVGNQGGCGSCWIWAALAAVESKVLIQYNKQASSFPLHLAEEQMVDCFGRNGCNGGWPTEAFDWIAKRGIVQEGYYPYEGQYSTCKSTASVPAAEIVKLTGAGFSSVRPYSATDMMKAVEKSPVPFVFAAHETDFPAWADKGAIYSGRCASQINHAMVLVGYNQGAGPGSSTAYWIVKNSWDTYFADGGFIKVPMLKDGTAGYCGMYELGTVMPTNVAALPRLKGAPAPKPSPPPPSGCVDIEPAASCKAWKNAGECDKNPDYMIGTPGVPGACQKTCDMCDSAGDKGDGSEEVPDANDECRDLNENCEYWASIGKCDTDAARMVGGGTRNGYCMRSCGYCDGSGDTVATCSDFDDSCGWWAEQLLCGKSQYVDVYCAASCGTCETVVIDDTAGNCYDNDPFNCAFYAAEGFCDPASDFSDWMSDNCRQSCGFCKQGCADASTYCAFMASLGDCTFNPDYMAQNCPVSCGYCTPVDVPIDPDPNDSGVCQDWDPSCPDLAATGYCTWPEDGWSEWMAAWCPLACGLCTSGGDCADVYIDYCPIYAAQGQCGWVFTATGQLVSDSCPVSCQTGCGDPSGGGGGGGPGGVDCSDMPGLDCSRIADRCNDPFTAETVQGMCPVTCGTCGAKRKRSLLGRA